MVIELFGLPGAGKTTFAKQLEADGFTVVKIRTKKELLYFNFVHLVRHPISSLMNAIFILKNSPNPGLRYYKFMNFFLDMNARYEKARLYGKAVLDQGYFQNVLSVFENPMSAEIMKRYIKHLPKPDKLIVLDILAEESLKRAGERGYYSRERFGDEYVENWRKVVLQNYDLFKKVVGDLGVEYEIVSNN